MNDAPTRRLTNASDRIRWQMIVLPPLATLGVAFVLGVLSDCDLRSPGEAVRTAGAFLSSPRHMGVAISASLAMAFVHAAVLVLVRRPRLDSSARRVALAGAFLLAPFAGLCAACALLISFQLSGVWLSGTSLLLLSAVVLSASVGYVLWAGRSIGRRTPESGLARVVSPLVVASGALACVALPIDAGARALGGAVFMPSLAAPVLAGSAALWILGRSVVRTAGRAESEREGWRRNRCRDCGYPREGLESDRCPECGSLLAPGGTTGQNPIDVPAGGAAALDSA